MSEMVERVARALCRRSHGAHETDPDQMIEHHGGTMLPYWCNFEAQARAAIAAMREPTEVMERIGDAAAANKAIAFGVCYAKAGRDIWRVMVDAELTPHPLPDRAGSGGGDDSPIAR